LAGCRLSSRWQRAVTATADDALAVEQNAEGDVGGVTGVEDTLPDLLPPLIDPFDPSQPNSQSNSQDGAKTHSVRERTSGTLRHAFMTPYPLRFGIS